MRSLPRRESARSASRPRRDLEKKLESLQKRKMRVFNSNMEMIQSQNPTKGRQSSKKKVKNRAQAVHQEARIRVVTRKRRASKRFH